MERKFIWTVLPNGARTSPAGGTVYRCSVFVSMRLTPDGASGELGDFDVGDWAATITSLAANQQFVFQIPTASALLSVGGTLLNANVDFGDGALEPGLWPKIFPATTPVRNFGYKSLASAKLFSYPVRAIHADLVSTYQQLAVTSPTEHPQLFSPELTNLAESLGRVRQTASRIEKESQGNILPDQTVVSALGLSSALPAAQRTRALQYYRAHRFYRRRIALGAPVDTKPPTIPDFDFHQMVTLLGDYPVLMRRLGLILDFELGRNIVAAPAQGTIRMAFANGGSAEDRFPRTYYDLDVNAQTFRARPEADSDLADGMLDLANTKRFSVTQTDVDGGSLKLVDYAATLYSRRANQANEQARESVPALRSGGLGVARDDRAQRLKTRFGRQDAVNVGLDSGTVADLDAHPLYADDLVRGYRVDVSDGVKWRSLCQRDGTYTLDPHGSPEQRSYADEGYVKSASVTGESDAPDQRYLHEHLFGWDGWSLVAQRPGRTVAFEKDPDDPTIQTPKTEEKPSTAEDKNVNVEARFKVTRGTLPRLRFGTSYQVRARAVDLAGNSVPVDSPDATHASPEVRYGRWEPIPQPVLVYRTKITEGESIEHMVIRSDRGVTVEKYVQTQAAKDAGYATTNERHVAPPKATQHMCELHGMFDELFASENPSSHRASYLLGLKEAGTFLDQKVIDPKSEDYVPVKDITLRSTDKTATPKFPAPRGAALQPGEYVTHGGTSVVLPYLPDPAAAGATLFDPSSNEAPTRAYEGSWPDLEPFRLVLRDASTSQTKPAFAPSKATFDVTLPQATILKVRYSSLPNLDELDKMALLDALGGSAAALDAAEKGLHWMLTPYRELTFVHAVQRPLRDPVASVQTDTTRVRGQTYASLHGLVKCHGRSTGQLDIKAYWIDPVDFVTADKPSQVFHEAQVARLSAAYEDTSVNFAPTEHRHELADTKHHRVVYQAVGTTRYREYFAQEIWEDTANITARETVLEPAATPDGLPTLTKKVVEVLSTVPPAPPKVLYAVPLFKWERSDDKKQLARRGGALRIYLDRPWYSSGEGELLAVLIAPNTGAPVPGDVGRYASQWASDPIRANAAPQNKLQAGHFLNAKAIGKGLSVPEGATNLTAVGFEPKFHPVRKLWYVDIELETGTSYFPFLRLSLARFQPDSIPGVELSTTVRGEFIQVSPHRTTSLTRAADVVTVTVVGPSGDDSDGGETVNPPLTITDKLFAPIDEVKPPSGKPTRVIADRPPSSDGPVLVGRGSQVIKTPDLKPADDKAERHVFRARLERHTGASDLDWEPLDDGTELSAFERQATKGQLVWRGQLSIPSEVDEAPDRYRIAVHEYEVFAADADVDVKRSAPEVHPIASHVASRLVFAAHLDVPT